MTTGRKRILLFEDDRFLRRACEVWLRRGLATCATAIAGPGVREGIDGAPVDSFTS
jgi:hypothetical protein